LIGGDEIEFKTSIEVIGDVARHDGSLGWCECGTVFEPEDALSSGTLIASARAARRNLVSRQRLVLNDMLHWVRYKATVFVQVFGRRQ